MQTWQWIVLAFLLLLPLSLMLDFWGRERLSARGRPGQRPWRPAPRPAPNPDEHH